MKKVKEKIVKRDPVVVVMGHIDHGKSTLLDYIRKANTVDKEHGGITQKVAAYEAEYNGKKITFIDTPGHEAFDAVRSRGASIADVAILVVAADDGFSEQSKKALDFILESGIPYIVAINKIDRPNADVNKTKNSLLEAGVYLEGMGGDIAYNEISALKGIGIDELLETVLLTADLEELTSNENALAEGYILESKLDPKKGIAGSLIIKNGKMKGGQYIVSGTSSAPVRIMLDYAGKNLKEAKASMPVNIIGFDSLPKAGDSFNVFDNKKEALKYIDELKRLIDEKEKNKERAIFRKNDKNLFPLVIRADSMGSIEAIKGQIEKINNDRSEFKIIDASVGSINESAVKVFGGAERATIVGFNAGLDNNAKFLAENLDIEIGNFQIIYDLIEFLEKRLEEITPKEKVEVVSGEAKVLRVFSWTNKGGVIGGEVLEGSIKKNNKIKVYRRGEYIVTATIKELQFNKQNVEEVSAPNQFGLNIISKLDIAEGDILKSVEIVEK